MMPLGALLVARGETGEKWLHAHAWGSKERRTALPTWQSVRMKRAVKHSVPTGEESGFLTELSCGGQGQGSSKGAGIPRARMEPRLIMRLKPRAQSACKLEGLSVLVQVSALGFMWDCG